MAWRGSNNVSRNYYISIGITYTNTTFKPYSNKYLINFPLIDSNDIHTCNFLFYLVCEYDGKGTRESHINKCNFEWDCTCKKGYTGPTHISLKSTSYWKELDIDSMYFNLMYILNSMM